MVRQAYENAKKSGLPVPPELKGTLAAMMPDVESALEYVYA